MKKQLLTQGKAFEFSQENVKNADIIIKKYPEGRQASALVPLLDLAQRQNGGWISQEALEYVSHYIHVPIMQAYEVVTFYSMFNLNPVGKYFLQVCTTTPCQLRGALEVLQVCHDFVNTRGDEIQTDPLFSICEVECLGACVNAPVVQINDDFYEDLDAISMKNLLESMKAGQPIKPGSQSGRHFSAPEKIFKKIKGKVKDEGSHA